jgi:hypothetical protein
MEIIARNAPEPPGAPGLDSETWEFHTPYLAVADLTDDSISRLRIAFMRD